MTTIAVAIVGGAITIWEAIQKRSHEPKRIKSDNFTRSNSEKSNIAIAIFEKLIIGWQHNYFVF